MIVGESVKDFKGDLILALLFAADGGTSSGNGFLTLEALSAGGCGGGHGGWPKQGAMDLWVSRDGGLSGLSRVGSVHEEILSHTKVNIIKKNIVPLIVVMVCHPQRAKQNSCRRVPDQTTDSVISS